MGFFDGKPPCRCAERREALAKASAAKAAGDMAEYDKQMEFVKTSSIEDGKAAVEWMRSKLSPKPISSPPPFRAGSK